MKLADLIEMEDEIVHGLRMRAAQGDNDAAKVLLKHLRATSANITKWKEAKVAAEKRKISSEQNKP